jgi:hypothetical protein
LKAKLRPSISSRLTRSTSPGVRTAQGRLHLIVAIVRTSKLVFVELHEEVTRRAAADLLRRLKQNAVATCNLKSLMFAVKRESAVERRLGRDSRGQKEAWLRKAGSGARDDG